MKNELTRVSLLLMFVGIAGAQSIDISGTVTNGTGGAALANVNVALRNQPGVTTTTGTDGTYHLISTGVIGAESGMRVFSGSRMNGSILEFGATGGDRVTIELFSASGSKVKTLTNGILARGSYALDLASQRLSRGLYVVRYHQGNITTACQYVSMSSTREFSGSAIRSSTAASLLKRMAGSVDTLVFTLSGYLTGSVPITSYTGQYNAVLQPAAAAPAGMRLIQAGTFMMGAPSQSDCPTPDGTNACPAHQVTLSAYYLDTTEVTQKDYVSLMGINPSGFTGDLNRPVEQVTWFDAVLYCNARSKRDGRDTVYGYTGVTGTPGKGSSAMANLTIDYTKNGYRLPTRAQWEYACRAGTSTGYYWGDAIDGDYCWYPGNANGSTHPVAQLKPNAWGLYDMSGNVKEWTNNWVDAPSNGQPTTNPTGPATGTSRFIAGGDYNAWSNDLLRSVYDDDYNYAIPWGTASNFGFRCERAY